MIQTKLSNWEQKLRNNSLRNIKLLEFFKPKPKIDPEIEKFKGNIENYIGLTEIPTGITERLKINGQNAIGDFQVPLATTEGALVASYSRGAKAITASGGAKTIILKDSVQRCPLFKFNSVMQCVEFVDWCKKNENYFKSITSKTSRFAQIVEINYRIEGNIVVLEISFSTGDASGQNMVTICSQKICEYIIEFASVPPKNWYIESNYSGDKKANFNSFINNRGKKVVAEIVLEKEVLKDILKTDAQSMFQYWLNATLSCIQSGSIGANGHYANGLAALFLATGQDVACVAEAAVGITRMEIVNDQNLYVSVTLPNLIVGTVGGGTGLQTQKECLAILGCEGEGKSKKLAEIAAALVLAGEISIAAAMSVGHFTKAHQTLGRK